MFKWLKSDRGIALLTVMVIMTVVVITGSLLLKMASLESRIIDNYGDNIRAFYVAEAGADLAIKEWDTYIAGLGVLIDGSNNQVVKANVNSFLTQLGTARDDLQRVIRTGYGLDTGSAAVSIEYSSEAGSWPAELDMSVSGSPAILTIIITGKYNNDTYEQRVQLWYYYDNLTGSYKGYDTATMVVHDPPPVTPPGPGGTPPEYHPPMTETGWTLLTGGGVAGQWSFDPATGTISRTPESGHDFLYNNDIIRVPFSLNMYMSFFNLHHDSDKYLGSFAGMGLGYDPWGIPHYAVYLTILDFGLGPQITVSIFNDFSLVAFGIFNQPMNGESSQYRIQVTAKTGEFKIIVSDGTGQEISHTSATTLRDGRMLLIDGTNSHADPKFTFP